MSLVIREKTNFDNMWIKAVNTETKSEVKFYISGTGERLTCKIAKSDEELFKKIFNDLKSEVKKTRSTSNYNRLLRIREKLCKVYGFKNS